MTAGPPEGLATCLAASLACLVCLVRPQQPSLASPESASLATHSPGSAVQLDLASLSAAASPANPPARYLGSPCGQWAVGTRGLGGPGISARNLQFQDLIFGNLSFDFLSPGETKVKRNLSHSYQRFVKRNIPHAQWHT
ncbi:hypothetical protein F4780DRAFT_705641 [Xylariomycetidae sp. FL0641]|nr:hypothetical protein F4780DRAFT_705641 [Xylariomycetidae sp. FL0641]